MQKVSLQVQQVQAYQIEQTELWKKLAKQQKAEMEFLKMECSKLRKALDATHIEKTNQSIQMKDTVRLLNEGNGRVSQQVNTMRVSLKLFKFTYEILIILGRIAILERYEKSTRC